MRPAIAQSMTTGARTAAAIQTYSDCSGDGCAAAMAAATVAIIPTATIPHPDTAVKDPAASIVSRMNARLSIARTCRAGGSGAGGLCKGVTDAMDPILSHGLTVVKYFAP